MSWRAVEATGGFRFDTGALCLDFVATLARRGRPAPQRVEQIPTPDRLGAWLRAAELVDGDVEVSRGDLISAVVLREAISGLLRGLAADEDVAPEARTVNEWACGPVATPQFEAATRTVRHDSAEPVTAALAEIARDAVELAGRLDRLPVRVCEQDDCRKLFVDRSRGRPRRWCSSRYCGNRAKVAAYRRRRDTI